MKILPRTFLWLALTACFAFAALTVTAQRQSGKDTLKPNPTPAPALKPIGSCDTIKGCKALKAACESKEVGGTFNPSKPDKSAGVCEKSASQGDLPANDLAAAIKKTGDAKCFTHALCGALKKTCKGTYSQPYPNVPQGTCKD
jgi:hypothetical protein